MPEERYFSMPSADVGAEVRRKRALNCWPWVRSLTHWPDAMIHSPAKRRQRGANHRHHVAMAACPCAVRRNHSQRCGRLLARRDLPGLPRCPAADYLVSRFTKNSLATSVWKPVAAYACDRATTGDKNSRKHLVFGPPSRLNL